MGKIKKAMDMARELEALDLKLIESGSSLEEVVVHLIEFGAQVPHFMDRIDALEGGLGPLQYLDKYIENQEDMITLLEKFFLKQDNQIILISDWIETFNRRLNKLENIS